MRSYFLEKVHLKAIGLARASLLLGVSLNARPQTWEVSLAFGKEALEGPVFWERERAGLPA